MEYMSEKCNICPRKCGADRTSGSGYCGAGDVMNISKIMLHKWEEPCISGTDENRGSGAVFFSGCNLRCIYCQNSEISHSFNGTDYTPEMLASELEKLQKGGAYNINFVTPTHYYPYIIKTLDIYRPDIPIIYNTGGYELAETIRDLSGYSDIFLSDFKYGTSAFAEKYSNAKNYVNNALEALYAMVDVVGKPEFDENGMLKKGVIVRHLVLPGGRHDSIKVLELLQESIGTENILLSLMNQYIPDFAPETSNIKRYVTTFEYNSVWEKSLELGFDGYSQSSKSARKKYVPDFSQNK